MMNLIRVAFFRIDRYVARIELFFLCITFTFLFSIGFYQVVSRELAGSGAIWPEHLLRYSVLVIGFLGASLASRENRNIRIDLITHFLGKRSTGRWWQVCEGILFLLGTVISVMLIIAVWKYISIEQMLAIPIPNTNIPTYWVFIVPLIFFSLSGVRYFFYSIFKFTGETIETHTELKEDR